MIIFYDFYVNIYFFKVATKTLEKGLKYIQSLQQKHQNDVVVHWRRSCVFIVNSEHISHLFLLFLLLTLDK